MKEIVPAVDSTGAMFSVFDSNTLVSFPEKKQRQEKLLSKLTEEKQTEPGKLESRMLILSWKIRMMI